MAGDLTEDRFFEQGDGLDAPEAWAEEELSEAEPVPTTAKGRGNKYIARRHIERYWELRALRNHLDDFDTVDPDF
jgi:hypothetical protein